MAIRVSETDRSEASLQAAAMERSGGGRRGATLEEEVFIAQLAARARLLNSEFQERVLGVVSAHSVTANQETLTSSKGCEELVAERLVKGSSSAMLCCFEGGMTGSVEVHAAAPKQVQRMREKLHKYVAPHPKAVWPLSANILDPIRASVVCSGPSEMIQVLLNVE